MRQVPGVGSVWAGRPRLPLSPVSEASEVLPGHWPCQAPRSRGRWVSSSPNPGEKRAPLQDESGHEDSRPDQCHHYLWTRIGWRDRPCRSICLAGHVQPVKSLGSLVGHMTLGSVTPALSLAFSSPGRMGRWQFPFTGLVGESCRPTQQVLQASAAPPRPVCPSSLIAWPPRRQALTIC